jgi:3-dehydroquinate synthetase
MTPQPGIDGTPLARAPDNVVRHKGGTGWTNTFSVPVGYTVEIVDGLLDAACDVLAVRYMPPGMSRRFCVVDAAVDAVYGDRLRAYFAAWAVDLTVVVVKGEEANKTFEAVRTVFDALVDFGLLRREPIFAIGGGCVLDIVGFAASCYRRGVPYVRVPTTLLGIVDASVGAKCGVDWQHPAAGGLKNRMGAFYPPLAALLDLSFIGSQDERNVVNGMGEVVKLALVRSPELFGLLEAHGRRLVDERFQGRDAVGRRVVELAVEVMLEELGPNLWEADLERCVDYGHTFSKILEMAPGASVMHGEAVAVDSALCLVLARRRGWIDARLRDRALAVMRAIGLPCWHDGVETAAMVRAVADGVEHRHGSLRMPLVKGTFGQYSFAQECGEGELRGAIGELRELHLEACARRKAAPRAAGDGTGDANVTAAVELVAAAAELAAASDAAAR